MPSRPASINFFSNPIGSLIFYPIIPIFGVNVHNNIAPKDVEEEFLFFASNLNGSFIIKNRQKVWILKVFGHFLKKIFCVKNDPLGPNFREMCKIWASKAQFLVTFSKTFSLVSQQYCFTCSLIPSTFRCVENMGFRGPIFGPLWAPK